MDFQGGGFDRNSRRNSTHINTLISTNTYTHENLLRFVTRQGVRFVRVIRNRLYVLFHLIIFERPHYNIVSKIWLRLSDHVTFWTIWKSYFKLPGTVHGTTISSIFGDPISSSGFATASTQKTERVHELVNISDIYWYLKTTDIYLLKYQYQWYLLVFEKHWYLLIYQWFPLIFPT